MQIARDLQALANDRCVAGFLGEAFYLPRPDRNPALKFAAQVQKFCALLAQIVEHFGERRGELCDLVASHAGAGTILAALALGIPQLCLPQRADQFMNAEAIASAGAGLTIPPDRVDAATVARAVRRLLEDPSYLRAARAIADEMALMPSPEVVTPVLEALAARP